MSTWNFADIFERVAARFPEAPAVIDGERTWTWAEFESRAQGLAADLGSLPLQYQSKVAVYSRNSSQFLEAYFGILKARLVPVNVNWRYEADELVYLLDNADVEAVVVAAEYAGMVERIAPRLPKVLRWYVVGEGDLPVDLPCVAYEDAIARHQIAGSPPGVATRSGDDLILIYTGGTTGMPKGVMWRQSDMFEALLGSSRAAFGLPMTDSVDDLVSGIVPPGPRGLAASPLMHATGLLHQFVMLLAGGTSVILTGRKFDAEHLWRTVATHAVSAVVIVGDAFAIPMLEYLDTHPGELDLSALEVISSSGAMWSRSLKEGLLGHLPWVQMYDALASSEGFGLAGTTMTAATVGEQAPLALGPNTRVIGDDGAWLSFSEVGGVGMVAVGGALPLGYYKDEDKSAQTFQTIEGERYSVPGDYVEILANSTVRFLGRGSACINTAGEKVYAEEVEMVVKDHPSVHDAACVGVPDARLGAAVCVVVTPVNGAVISKEAMVIHVSSRLASYKAPRHLVSMSEIPRTAQGKVDYPKVHEYVDSLLATGADR